MMAYENVRTEIRDGILYVTIDRPKVLNALNAETVEEIGRAFSEARHDDSIRCVILTGAGEKAFVAGADINELATMTPLSGKQVSEKGQNVFLEIERFPKPVIAAINGFALGGGCELALACHIRIASEKRRSVFPKSRSASSPATAARNAWRASSAKGKRSSWSAPAIASALPRRRRSDS